MRLNCINKPAYPLLFITKIYNMINTLLLHDNHLLLQEIALIITFAGALSTMLYYCGLLRNETENESEEYGAIEGTHIDLNKKTRTNTRHFLKSHVIYCVSLM